jgi:alpha-L-fucosidase
VHPQVLDLVERYGTRMLWGDGHWGGGEGRWRSDELIAAVHAIDPSIVVNDRWWWDGPGVANFEYRQPDHALAVPWEMRRGLGTSFGHNRAEPIDSLLHASALIAVLTEVLAKGGHLLLSIGVDIAGRLPPEHAEIVREAGRWVHEFDALVNRSTPWTTWGDAGCRFLVVDGVLHAVDLTGTGRFAAVSPAVGRVAAVSSVSNPGVAFEFDQAGDGLRVHTRRSLARGDVAAIEVYRIDLEPVPPAPIELFPSEPSPTLDLADALAGARRGQIVQLGDAVYVGPAHVPDGVTLRGLGPDRTTIDGLEAHAVSLGAGARVEHCALRGGGSRIVWLPKIAAVISGRGASLLGCRVEGHVRLEASDARVTSCVATGVVASGVDHVTVARSTLRGMQWDTAIDITEGGDHLIEGCEIGDVLEAIRLTRTTGAVVRGNRIRARWWGVRAVDTEATIAVGNAVTAATRAFDVDGGTLAEVTGNAVADGDSGCVVQRGAVATQVTGNRWERTRIGLLAWDSAPVAEHGNTAVDLGEPEAMATVGP